MRKTKAKKQTKKPGTAKRSASKVRTGGEDSNGDIVQLILSDHKPLKDLIGTMKDVEQQLDDRWEAFRQFAPLLLSHSIPEEEVLYKFLKQDDALREEGFEGEYEHILADQMVEEARRERDDDRLSAQIKVLAELVEHHIQEEEKTILPEFRKNSGADERRQMGEKFLRLKDQVISEGADNAPPENVIREHAHY